MSPSGRRLLATLGALWVLSLSSATVRAVTLPNSTWVPLTMPPHQGHVALLALAVDPTSNQSLLAGDANGSLLRSADGGATWTTVHAATGATPVETIAFSPYKAGLVLAGTRGGGAFFSQDGGKTWSTATGLEHRDVRIFAFALSVAFAGTDHGVFGSSDATAWSPTTLTHPPIDSLAVEAIHDPVHVVAGTGTTSSGGLQLFQSNDAGVSWSAFTPPVSGTFAVRLLAGPLPPTGNVRPLLAGTNAGLFLSKDDGATFVPLSGGALLPTTDYTQLAFITTHSDRFYAASDGGGSGGGGLWRTDDGGTTFRSLAPPEGSVTALAVSADESPVLYVATFRAADHLPELWGFHDTGDPPQGPSVTASPLASGARLTTPSQPGTVTAILTASELPYVGLGLGALIVILVATVAQLRSRRR